MICTVYYKESNHIYWKWVHGKDLRDFLNNEMPELGGDNNHFDRFFASFTIARQIKLILVFIRGYHCQTKIIFRVKTIYYHKLSYLQ